MCDKKKKFKGCWCMIKLIINIYFFLFLVNIGVKLLYWYEKKKLLNIKYLCDIKIIRNNLN